MSNVDQPENFEKSQSFESSLNQLSNHKKNLENSKIPLKSDTQNEIDNDPFTQN